METSNTKATPGATGGQAAPEPAAQRRGGFIPGAVVAQGCCGEAGGGSAGCCGEPATITTVTSAPQLDAAPVAAQGGCCGAPRAEQAAAPARGCCG
ncbi:MAG TPA: hypothetical protein VGJ87_18070 [Roseiflexaceae bacterium]|jgi:hypothetical protein